MLTTSLNAEKIQVPGESFYQSDIYGKNLTVLQAKSLQRLSLTMDIKGIFKLLGENLSIDVNKIYFDDFKYIMHWFRIKSFTNFPHQLKWKCPYCNHEQVTSVLSENLIIDDIPPELDNNGGMRLRFDNYPQGLYIRAPKVGDEFMTTALMKKYNIPEDDYDMKGLLMDLNLLRNTINGLDLEQLYQDYKDNKFTPDDLMAITAFREGSEWGVKDDYRFNCPDCKEEVIVHEPLDITTFFQPGESQRHLRDRVLPSVPSPTEA